VITDNKNILSNVELQTLSASATNSPPCLSESLST